jgi:amino acid adenylation domain-containing protein/non-ribosomal peptide synthase protein (TIGR01720 family)
MTVTLIDVLRERLSSADKGITFIESGHHEEFLSYPDLYGAAIRALAALQRRGLRKGDEVVFQIADNKTFIIVFWACILGGFIPVPLTLGQNEEHRLKCFNVWQVLNTPWLIISDPDFDRLGEQAHAKGLEEFYACMDQYRMDARELLSSDDEGQPAPVGENDIAFLQFSSGSTGKPKGVVLTHRNLLVNMRAIGNCAGYSPADTLLSWMPLTHDMGLIGFHLNPVLAGMSHYLMPVSLFIRRPLLWIDKASQHRISVLSSPNFGLTYLLRNLGPGGKDNWDLSAVRIIYNGAEPISERTARQFTSRLAEYGLPDHAICPVYGLAEATLAVTMTDWREQLHHLELHRDHLKPGGRITLSEPGHGGISFVNVGKPVDDMAIRITDRSHNTLPENTVGHVLINGGSVTGGYYNNIGATRAAAGRDGWWDTGDLGFIRDGFLYITGRYKDMICINGRNCYPHDLERVAEEAGLVELNKFVVGACLNGKDQKEEIIGFLFHRESLEKFIPLARRIKAIVNDKTGIELDRLIPVKEIPRTTSGKLQRFKLLEQYAENKFRDVQLALDRVAAESPAAPVSLPANDHEQRLLGMYREILGNDSIGVEEGWFVSGGNSLKAAALMMAVWKNFGVELPLDILYEKQTVRELARIIGNLSPREYVPLVTPVDEGMSTAGMGASHYLPLSSAQKRLYYQWQMDTTSIAYNIPLAFEVAGDIDAGRMEACICQLIQRHEVLRTSFHMDAEPTAAIHPRVDFALQRMNCPAALLEKTIAAFIRPFDLSVPPSLRAALVMTDNHRQLLLMDFHHIISDGVSITLFLNELFRLYDGKLLPELPAQYKNYVAWEISNRGSKKWEMQEVYWRGRLAGELPSLQMPLDFQRPVLFSTEGKRLFYRLGPPAVAMLRDIARSCNCTLQVVIQTIYKVLLFQYTGQDDLVIGIPTAGRRHPDLRDIQGMFVNNLAIRTTIRGDEPFRALVESERNNINEALDNQDYPFGSVLEWVDQDRDVSRNRVFDSMFVYQNMAPANLKASGFSLTRYPFDPGVAKYDISMEVTEEGEYICYVIEYATRMFREDTIRRFAQHFERLIRWVIYHPDAPVSELRLLDEKEYEECIHGLNATKRDYPADGQIQQLFEAQVLRTPSDIAVECGHVLLSYQQLNELADQLANRLMGMGIGAGSVVGLLLPRSSQLVVAILGVLKAGACYLPIDTDLPGERIRYILEDSRCRMVMAAPSLAPLAAGITDGDGEPLLTVLDPYGNSTGHEASAGKTPMPPETSRPLAYIIYTSGTTGRPKGVMVGHQSLVNYISWAAGVYNEYQKADYPLYTSISFDLTVTSLFTPLITGGRIVVYDGAGDELMIEKVIADNTTDIIKATPSHLKLILGSQKLETLGGGRIKKFIVGGEDLDSRLADAIYCKFGGKVSIYNEYGPTEATVGCMIHQYQPNEDLASVPIGVPAANTCIYLLDRFLQPVPVGVAGEMYIAGDGLALGYAGNPALTDARFVANPFIPGTKMYRTGDLAKRLSSGIILYAGRMDRQIKISGYRIEPAEIENHLLSHPAIKEATIVVRTDVQQKKSIQLYYTVKDPCEDIPREAALKSFLAARLPYYMIPVRLIALEKMPLTSNGKIDSAALPAPGETAAATGTAPKNDIEAISLQVWEEVLGQDNLSVTDNFFELGGDSIKAVQIVSALAANGIVVTVKDILTFHTVEQIAARATTTAPVARYQQGLLEGDRELLPIESWFFSQGWPQPGYYNQSVLLRLNRIMDRRLLETAFDHLIRHHDGLRMNYSRTDGRLFYNNDHLNRRFVLEEEDSSGRLPGGHGLFFREEKDNFDLGADLLIKASLYKEGDQMFLFITAHHLVIDGMSWRILLEDLYRICHALENDELVQLPRKTAGGGDFLKALAARAEVFASQENYWKEIEKTGSRIPMDYITAQWNAGVQRRITGALTKEDTVLLLQDAPKKFGADTFTLLNTALVLTLKEWTGLERFVVEQENFGRQGLPVDTSRTVGWFTSMYPVSLEVGHDTLPGIITGVKDQLSRVPDYGVGYGVLRYGHKDDGRHHTRRRSVRFNYLGQFGREFNNDLFSFDPRLTGLHIHPDNGMTTKLDCISMVVGGQLIMEFNYNSKAHRASTIHWLKTAFLNHLNLILHHQQEQTTCLDAAPDFNTAGLDQSELNALFE